MVCPDQLFPDENGGLFLSDLRMPLTNECMKVTWSSNGKDVRNRGKALLLLITERPFVWAFIFKLVDNLYLHKSH